jgi:YesN/AraC family two-component response regulator
MNIQINDQMLKEMTNDQLKTMLERIQEELDEREWNAILAKPQSIKMLEELAQKALKEHLEGKTIKGGFGRE